ncbi:hypothetical protein A2X44_05245 [candidate division CPR3 bacterium GWF2_35_18]|uniref:Carboxy-terminal-processing protease n=1 Tax=candidate division CPR3 bacterium GW2011_GWF2_35_18 TaxID=1618350 RepID=A0A0G0ER98_UNCC3|nr:MAG: Carboxy-terminal-processing protease [candidate division CPR3 bacterium GW2011_GWF2_35_18]KKP87155.1 MAG: Carboxy-terminal-processing protease [candidate division CPR3 bacterium GW2011_GWE2_35_7]OGB63729.1 MAG: hypothetical protein A2X44_05245 [candidate division CPR3 bacterium GWF2_35_18]OGB64951.1 MAG: hypothetical protein A2250_00800 [candidate division CPR3 bacterium RIFOXYA2_FULL_35_13]OGB76571.1 MAG: hypothetical protein A2476_00970 [candidate division CPR3 bacterium RIFOXYC2_FULL
MVNPEYRTIKVIIYIISAIAFFVGGFFVGNFQKNYYINLSGNKITIENKSQANQNVDFSIFWKVWDEVSNKYLYQEDVDPQKMVYGAIKGMVASLDDPYSIFLDPEEFAQLKESMASTYEGIGIEMGFKDNQIVVITPFEGSPAIKSGIKAGDYILKINDEITTNMSLSESASKIRGENKTKVKLTLQHQGESDPYEVEIVRSVITYDTVTIKFIDDDIAYVRILQFGDDTNAQWDDAISEIQSQNPKGVILDLRNNPGGYVSSASYIVGDFVGSKVAVKQKFSDSHVTSQKSINSKQRLKDYKVILLLNEGSASASEILAGALKYYNIVTIVGEKSFGKGIVQDQIPLSSGTGLHVTTSEWLTPGDQNIHKQGIEPDIQIEMTEDDIKKGIDPQLDKAKELVSVN